MSSKTLYFMERNKEGLFHFFYFLLPLIILPQLLNKLAIKTSIISNSLFVNFSIIKMNKNVHTYIKVYTHARIQETPIFRVRIQEFYYRDLVRSSLLSDITNKSSDLQNSA